MYNHNHPKELPTSLKPKLKITSPLRMPSPITKGFITKIVFKYPGIVSKGRTVLENNKDALTINNAASIAVSEELNK